jgi:hypothetical protein
MTSSRRSAPGLAGLSRLPLVPWCTWGAICSPLLQQCHPHPRETQYMATIVRRPGKNGQQVYRVQVRRKRAPPLSATFTKLSDARKWVQVTEAAILEGRYFPTTEAKRHTLADLIDRYCRDILPSKAPESHRKHASNSAGGVGTVCLRILLRAALPSTATR